MDSTRAPIKNSRTPIVKKDTPSTMPARDFYESFARAVVCSNQPPAVYQTAEAAGKDARIREYFEVLRGITTFQHLETLYDLVSIAPRRSHMALRDVQTLSRIAKKYNAKLPQCILGVFSNVKDMPTRSDDNIGAHGVDPKMGRVYYKFMLHRSTGLSSSRAVRMVKRAGAYECKRIQRELRRLAHVPSITRSFTSYNAMGKYITTRFLPHILNRLRPHFPKLETTTFPPIRVRPSKRELSRAYYELPPVSCTYPKGDPSKGGKVVIHIDNLADVDMGSLAALLVHEVIPGHYFQTVVYPSDYYVNATPFVEGWGLYVEGFLDILGPAYRRARLRERLVRAARCVIDPAIHYDGLSHKQAVQKYRILLPFLSRKDAKRDITRYAAFPGQACSYLIGCLFLERLADKYKHQLRKFHDRVLSIGPRPYQDICKQLEEAMRA